jgi:phospholipid transport system substrate-binding protein
MLIRREVIALMAALPFGLAARARALSAADAATAFLKTTGDKLVAVVNGPMSDEERREALTTIIDSAVDVAGVARFCLGRFWRTATPEQQQQYLTLFHGVLVRNIEAKLGEYRGVRFTVGRTQDRDEGELVFTVIERPNNPPANVQWLIADALTAARIIDVIAEGTSLRVTQREDYSSFLTHNGYSIASLLQAMHQQISQSG